ncbi:MAG: LysM peptidoglycan-binding domain-containing protein [Epsilonproteobacteria bacterium]|nr:LysM peptidoglycan-binding domain-containing protein [Campylobacterota bacterium]
MYNNGHDEYLEATQEARINQVQVLEKRQGFVIPLVLVSAVVVGYLGYNSIEKPTNGMIASLELKEEKYTVKDEHVAVVSTKVEKSEIIEQVPVQKEESKTEDYFIVTIQKGDTLASLSKKYFGNEMSFNRILDFNDGLKEKTVLNIGQKLYIPR